MNPHHPILAAASKFEPRLARAFVKAMRTLRSRFDRQELTAALKAKDKRRALACVPSEAEIRDVLTPFAAILKDALVQGGKLAEINRGK